MVVVVTEVTRVGIAMLRSWGPGMYLSFGDRCEWSMLHSCSGYLEGADQNVQLFAARFGIKAQSHPRSSHRGLGTQHNLARVLLCLPAQRTKGDAHTEISRVFGSMTYSGPLDDLAMVEVWFGS